MQARYNISAKYFIITLVSPSQIVIVSRDVIWVIFNFRLVFALLFLAAESRQKHLAYLIFLDQ